MANIYLDNNTPGSGTSPYDTWAKAATTLAAALGADAEGDTVYIYSAHSETTASALTFTLAGTLASPMRVLSTDKAAEPPTALAAGAIIATSSANNITYRGTGYTYGVSFKAGTGSGDAFITIGGATGDRITLDTCTLQLVATGTGCRIQLSSAAANDNNHVVLNNCTFTFGNTSQGISVRDGRIRVTGGATAGSALTTLVQVAAYSGDTLFEGVDFSSCAAGVNLVDTGEAKAGTLTFRNCKLPTSWSGGLVAGAPSTAGLRVEMFNCAASGADTNYSMWIEEYAGTIKASATKYRNGGASDGTTPISWEMVSTANAEYPMLTLTTPEIVVWNETVGSALTASIEIAVDSAGTALKDDEIWLELQYLGTDAQSISTIATDAKAGVLSAAADQTTSIDATWTGLTTPTMQKLTVGFTPREKGFVIGRVHLAKASQTVYVCPKMTVA